MTPKTKSMMRRRILTYLPANAVPAVLAVLMIYTYTRLLSVEAYGEYSLAFTAGMIAQTGIFTPLHSSAIRLFPAAERDGVAASFLRTLYGCVGLIGIGIALLALPLMAAISGLKGSLPITLVLALPLLLLRGVIQIAQGMNRMRDRHAWYVGTECAHAVLGLAASVAFLGWSGASGESAGAAVMGGLVAASALCAAANIPSQWPGMRFGRIDSRLAQEFFRFGAPLALVLLTNMLLQYADRFAMAALSGAGAVGIYAVAFALVERPTTLLCMSIATATYPLAVRALEREGPDAARLQAGWNGVALIGVIVPACIGIALSAGHVSAVLIGPAYRAGAASLIEILAFRALVRGISTHFVEQAFYLARRPSGLLPIYGLAAVANIAADIAVIPFFGVIGAAWVALGCQVAALAASWLIGRRLFPVWLPLREVASVLMAA
ncbi:MAG: oligosaccharide flippase family protein, partial [Rhodopila sp.]